MRFEKLNRRHFLQGLGCSLALPFLPSLSARAATSSPNLKYFFAMGTMHGGVPMEDWAPIDRPLNEVQLYNGDPAQGFDHKMRFGALRDLTRPATHAYNPSGAPELSRVLGSFLNPYLDKLTLLNGLDVMYYMPHQWGGNLGNFHGMVNENEIANSLLLPSMPTIDRVIARSPSFYGAGDPFTVRSINFNPDRGLNISMDGPVGSVESAPTTASSPRALFDSIFGDISTDASAPSDPRLSIIDRVLNDYNRVMNSPNGEGSRISNADRNRLDEFVTGLRDAERKFENVAAGGSADDLSPPDPSIDVSAADMRHSVLEPKIKAYLDVIVAAFKCGRSRVATTGLNQLSDDFNGNWHQDIAHGGRSDIWLDYIIRHNRFAAEHVFGYMVEQLDVSIDGVSDTTYLDNSLLVWNHECGQKTHIPVSLPTLVAGSAGGFLKTGELVDYRNLSSDAVARWAGSRPDLAHTSRPGIPYNRWLYTALRAMGIPDSDYKVGPLANMQSYGDPFFDNEATSNRGFLKYSPAVLNDLGRPLEEIVA